METNKKDDAIMRLSMAVICLTLLVLVLIGILLSIYFSPRSPKNEKWSCGVTEQPLCGNAIRLPPNVSYHSFDNGEKLFIQNCAVCHSLGSNLITGPGLKGLSERIPNNEWLVHYISNSDSLLKKQDAYTLKIHKQYSEKSSDWRHLFNKTLTAEEIKNLITYVSVQRDY